VPEPEDALVFSTFLDWLDAIILAIYARIRRRHLPHDVPYLEIHFARFGEPNMATATVVFNPPVPPNNPNDAVTSRTLTVTIDGTAAGPVPIDLTASSYVVPTPVNTGQTILASLADTNPTGSREVGSVTKTVPDMGAGQPPLDATGLDITFAP
jgi:hypothetical protein